MSISTFVPGVRKEEWAQATDKAKEVAASVGEMASHAVSAAGVRVSQAACDVGKRADELTAQAGVGIHHMGDSLGRNMPQSGVLGTASQAMADTVRNSGDYLEEAKLSGIAHDVFCMIRRNPLQSVLVSVGIGWFVARKLWK